MRRCLLQLGRLFALLVSFWFISKAEAGGLKKYNLIMGKPSNAKTDPKNAKNDFLISREEYALSYNDSLGIPNWVSWYLTKSQIGSQERSDFKVDPDLPAGFKKVTPDDYTNTGFNRGHMCPAKDRSTNAAANQATFYMTNMVPQAPNNNQQTWKALETYCRTLAENGNELFIVCGPSGTGGSGSKGAANQISSKNIRVPAYVWKVILVLPKGKKSPKDVTAKTRVIAVKMDNKNTVTGTDWGKYIVTIAEIETDTGFTFFREVDAKVRKKLRTIKDAGP
jgi:endonuclease G, mitochondrial